VDNTPPPPSWGSAATIGKPPAPIPQKINIKTPQGLELVYWLMQSISMSREGKEGAAPLSPHPSRTRVGGSARVATDLEWGKGGKHCCFRCFQITRFPSQSVSITQPLPFFSLFFVEYVILFENFTHVPAQVCLTLTLSFVPITGPDNTSSLGVTPSFSENHCQESASYEGALSPALSSVFSSAGKRLWYIFFKAFLVQSLLFCFFCCTFTWDLKGLPYGNWMGFKLEQWLTNY
jgi:hypothetical protein